MLAQLLISVKLCANKCLEQLINSGILCDPVFSFTCCLALSFPVCSCRFDRAFIHCGAGEEQCSDPYLI